MWDMAGKQNPKDRHHHVWQQYLRAWRTDGTVWCKQGDRIYQSGTSVLAVQRGFYKLNNLTAKERNFIRALISKGHPLDVKFCNEMLNNFMLPFDLYEIATNGRPNVELANQIERYASEHLENHHSLIEAKMLPYLARALEGDIGFYADEDESIDFLHYLAMQFMRTKPVRERVLKSTACQEQIDMERIWNILMFLFGFRVGLNLYRERNARKLILIKNESDVAFITGDQPAINLCATWTDDQPDSLSIYYPISPKLALLLEDVNKEPIYAESITSEQAAELNTKLKCSCHSQIFGLTKEALE